MCLFTVLSDLVKGGGNPKNKKITTQLALVSLHLIIAIALMKMCGKIRTKPIRANKKI